MSGKLITLKDLRQLSIEEKVNLYKEGYLLSPDIEALQEQPPFINTIFGVFLISFVASFLASYVLYKQMKK